jgi:hypothetical protein
MYLLSERFSSYEGPGHEHSSVLGLFSSLRKARSYASSYARSDRFSEWHVVDHTAHVHGCGELVTGGDKEHEDEDYRNSISICVQRLGVDRPDCAPARPSEWGSQRLCDGDCDGRRGQLASGGVRRSVGGKPPRGTLACLAAKKVAPGVPDSDSSDSEAEGAQDYSVTFW